MVQTGSSRFRVQFGERRMTAAPAQVSPIDDAADPAPTPLAQARRQAVEGDPAATQAQHKKGKLTARERISLLLDPDSFHETEPWRRHRARGFGLEDRRPHGDGVLTGWGLIDGRQVFLYAHDFRVFGGSLGEAHAEKIHKVMDLAQSVGAPLISLNDGAGARIQEGVTALAGYGGIFRRNVHASGVIPQISVMLGPCAGGASYSPALTDFVFMVPGIAQMFLTGPDVVRAVTGETVTAEELGGAELHARQSGLATFVREDEASCFDEVRALLAMLPSNNREAPPAEPGLDPATRRTEALLDIVPAESNQPYDVRQVIGELVDEGDFLELHVDWAQNIVCALARMDGHVVGIVANQPLVLAGVLDIPASQKAARFVRMCDAFNIPLITLVDVPGFLPGLDQETGGIIRHGAQLLYAYCDATVPRIQVIMRKAYGGAYIVMDSRSIGCDLSYAWPTNEVAVMGADGATAVVHRRALSEADDPDALREQLAAEYRTQMMHPFYGAEHGLVDDVIDPADTRTVLCSGLQMLLTKQEVLPARKHGNQPQ
jgi:acetyl-CoA carboxylase carboxyltransferase component